MNDNDLKASIFIVDDAEDMRLLLQSLLKEAGYTNLTLLSSAKDASDRLGINKSGSPSSATPSPELILTDIAMPGIDGIELCKMVKSTSRLRDIPIIMISALGESRLIEAALEAGAMDYIEKPVDRIELVARLRSALRLKREIDEGKRREEKLLQLTKELEEANRKLKAFSLSGNSADNVNQRQIETDQKKE